MGDRYGRETQVNFERLAIEGAWCIQSPVFNDTRGTFSRLVDLRLMEEHGIDRPWVQENLSTNNMAGTLRGLHFQRGAHAETKLVRCVSGRILDVLVDLRDASPTYGHALAVELSEENAKALLVPKGCAHGYLTLSENSHVLYLVDQIYAPDAEGGLAWNSPEIRHIWNLPEGFEPQISERDKVHPQLTELKPLDVPFS